MTPGPRFESAIAAIATSFGCALLILGSGCAANLPSTGASTGTAVPDAAPADSGPLAPLAWLGGAWSTEDGGTSITEERWTPPAAGTMLGTNREIVGNETRMFEFLRIEARPGGQIIFVAHPRGRSPGTEFPLLEMSTERVVFENPEHDFPQRLDYRLEEDRLTVEVTALQDGERRGFELVFRRIEH